MQIESLSQNVNVKTTETVTEVITDITTAATTKAKILLSIVLRPPTFNLYFKNFQIFDGFNTLYPATFVKKIVDLSITPTINKINKISAETKKSLNELQESATVYKNTFYHDTGMMLDTVK